MTSEELLRRLTIGDPRWCRAVVSAQLDDYDLALDPRSLALLRLGGSLTTGLAGPVWQQRVGAELEVLDTAAADFSRPQGTALAPSRCAWRGCGLAVQSLWPPPASGSLRPRPRGA